MQKAIISSVLFLLVLIALAFNIKSAKDDIENFMKLGKTIENLTIVNKELDIFVKKNDSFVNFDTIEHNIDILKSNFYVLSHHKILQKKSAGDLRKTVKVLQKKIRQKIAYIRDIKALDAIIINSYRFMPKIKEYIHTQKFNDIYANILMTNLIDDFNTDETLQKINSIKPEDKFEKMFLNHARIVIEKIKEFKEVKTKIDKLALDKEFKKFSLEYETLINVSINNAQTFVIILFIILILFILFYLYYSSLIIYKNIQVERFKKTIESSDNIVLVTDKDEKIKYVNEAFTRSTGYSFEEVKGKKPSILRSNKLSKEFYKKLHDTIHSGNKWHGEFINMTKQGETRYEKASITPVLDKDGKIIEFVALKLDITKEVLAKAELEMKNEQLIQQSKMASMGEMIENIAHQWRQPLSVISTAATGMKMEKEFGVSKEEKEFETLDLINNTAQHLSQTIDDFRDFFKPDRLSGSFNIKDSYIKTFNIIESKFKNRHIEIIENIDDITIDSFENELIQILMNILNNARDVLETKEGQRRLLFITIKQKDDNVIISMKDNGGGIPEKIQDKIFEPYFTTKHQAQGTGIGLYMTKEMTQRHLQGTIEVVNEKFSYENKEYEGANFILTLPKKVT